MLEVLPFECTCAHCHAALLADARGWRGWMLCPRCERPFLPPEPDPHWLIHEAEAGEIAGAAREEPADALGRLIRPAGAEDGASVPWSPVARTSAGLFFSATGLVVSSLLSLMAYLDRSPQNATIFGVLSVAFLFAVVQLRKRRSRW
jgi:hypothetical protein